MSGQKAVHMPKKAIKAVEKETQPKADTVIQTTTPVEKKPTAKKVTKKVTPAEKPAEKQETPTPVVEKKAEAVKPSETVQKVKESQVTEAEKAPTTQQPNNTTTIYLPEFDLKELLETGAHFGHQARRWHPKMAPYIYDKRGGVHIFDLIKTADQLKRACQFVYEIGKSGKTIVFVGTKRQARDIVKTEAEASGAMYIINRWLGGFMSNWEQVSKTLKEMLDIKKGLEEGKFNHYTKKERVLLAKRMERHERFFGGMTGLKKVPDALFLVDIGREKTALTEAVKFHVPVVGLVDTNHDPSNVDYVIPANDDAVSSIQYIVHAVAEAYKAGVSAKK